MLAILECAVPAATLNSDTSIFRRSRVYSRNWLVRAQWSPSVISGGPFSRKGAQERSD